MGGPKRKLILTNHLSPGDIVMLTAAVRDLHLTYPGRFLTDVRTSCAALWRHNPYLVPLREGDPGVEVLECHYPLIHHCNETPYHCLHGFVDFLNDQLGLDIKPTAFHGDIHLSREEKAWYSQVRERTRQDTPFWIVVSGGKLDVTVKWWEVGRYQEVIDHFRNKILFVQVGEGTHYHPPLNGVLDLRGRTDLRQLVRLVHHSQGVLCPVTCLMHLAAAVEDSSGHKGRRPCVVVAGGREPPQWEAYPHHQFIHTIGALPCCTRGGCWKNRTFAVGDGDHRDDSSRVCVNVSGALPRCMDMISSQEVARRIETYFEGGRCDYLTPRQARAAWKAVSYASPVPKRNAALDVRNARIGMDRFIRTIPPYPGGYGGRGIVICAGGLDYFTNAWVCVNRLRRLGCKLPVELWHLGEEELDAAMRRLVRPLGVRCVDGLEMRKIHPARILRGWELKSYAILHSPFREVLLLDADNVPVLDPEFLFDTPQYKESGAIFWPDLGRWKADHKMWSICGIHPRDEPEFESGQIVVDKRRCWRALRLALWMNEHSDFFYKHIHGDKDTFHLAFRKFNQAWSMTSHPIRRLHGTLCQHDFNGRRVFQHRSGHKWNLLLPNAKVDGFRHEEACRANLDELGRIWDGRMGRYERNGRSPLSARKGTLHNEPPTIQAVMISCPQRERLRKQTLRNLAATDWGEEPVRVRVDEGLADSPKISQCRNAFLLLEESLDSPAAYILFLEDDLEFNRHLRHNLLTWRPLLEGRVTLASFFNPGIRALACDVNNHCFVPDPQAVWGSLALVLARETARYLVRHWNDESGAHDLRMPRLAGRLKKPLYVHCPSLVFHTGKQSTWGTAYHQAIDFQPHWKRR